MARTITLTRGKAPGTKSNGNNRPIPEGTYPVVIISAKLINEKVVVKTKVDGAAKYNGYHLDAWYDTNEAWGWRLIDLFGELGYDNPPMEFNDSDELVTPQLAGEHLNAKVKHKGEFVNISLRVMD